MSPEMKAGQKQRTIVMCWPEELAAHLRVTTGVSPCSGKFLFKSKYCSVRLTQSSFYAITSFPSR